MNDMDGLKNISTCAIDAQQDALNSLSLSIWNQPELSSSEVYAHKLLTDFLEDHGFEVQRHTPLQTSFIARYRQTDGKTDGQANRQTGGQTHRLTATHEEYNGVAMNKQTSVPRIGIMCEYDALPAIGHACGHNLIAQAGIAASIGAQAALQSDVSLRGEVVVFGTPAEEQGGGKIKMIKAGSFQSADVCMMVHPYKHNLADPIVLANLVANVSFHGKATHAAAAPWDGLNALDAAVGFYNNLSMLRQQMIPTNRLHAVITDGGCKPNIIPRTSALKCVIRGQSNADVLNMQPKLDACAHGSAAATGCSVDVEWMQDRMYESLLSNPVLLDLFTRNATEHFGMRFDPNTDRQWASTDAGNVSQVMPTIQPCFGIEEALDASLHTEEFAAAARLPGNLKRAMDCGKTMACVAIDLMRDPGLVKRAMDEFVKIKEQGSR